MATVEIKVTYNPAQETLESVLGSMLGKSPAAEPAHEQTMIPEFMQAPKSKPEAPAAEAKPEAEPEAPAAEAKPTVSKADVRALAVKLSKTDKAKLMEILRSTGASKLSEVPEDKLEELHRKLVEANA